MVGGTRSDDTVRATKRDGLDRRGGGRITLASNQSGNKPADQVLLPGMILRRTSCRGGG